MAMLKIAATQQYHISALDVGSAYTNANIDRESYMVAPDYLTEYFLMLDPNIKHALNTL